LRHRPRRLADIVGQKHVTTVLQRALAADRLPHQLLFSGGSGLGKTTVARVVAAALLCEQPVDGDACASCASCLDIFEPGRVHPDVVEFDAASNGLKEQIRELASRALTAPARGRYRVYIIDEAHGLSQGGGQAFLKLLEEPPAHVVFMLATTDPDKMLRTNRGRCVEFELARPADAALEAHLCHVAASEGWPLSGRAARTVIDATDPQLGVRGLLMTLEKLQEALSWGVEPDDDELSQLLGLPPAALVEALWSAIEAGEKTTALDALATLQARTSDDAARRALRERARRAMLDALAGGTGELALWRFEQLLATPAGQLWTSLVVAKLARVDLEPDARVLGALVHDAEAAARRLADSLRTVPAPVQDTQKDDQKDVRKPEPAKPAPAKPSAKPGVTEKPSQKATQEAAHTKPAQAKPAAPTTPEPTTTEPTTPEPKTSESKASHTKPPASLVDAFLAEVAQRSRSLAAVLRSCGVEADGSTIRVKASPAAAEKLRAQSDTIKAAGTAAGATVTLSVKK
jgi:DNA polymerase-3 subunit gamma/tau